MERARDLSHNAYEQRKKEQEGNSKKKSDMKPIELIDNNKVALMIEKEEQESRNLDPDEDIQNDRNMRYGSGNRVSMDDETQRGQYLTGLSPRGM